MTRETEIAYSFIAYINKTLINEKMKYLRNAHRNLQYVYDEQLLENIEYEKVHLLDSISEYTNMEEYIDNESLSNAISKLNLKEKYILYHKFVAVISDKKIGEKLRISSQAVSKQKRKIFDKVKHSYENKDT
ncbi:sigma-70 family RNA polymerase sigma factor [Carnobacterium gallinarum]|uniref:sigma-70 family RNA polymerase sigma factor n=1 Tax=Carnobacterium gallinarum TaxID=2749 RepID=UPI000552239A|nr:sigma-70 family RNA polymerase sigma factor [Carnobacterium gallinarum]